MGQARSNRKIEAAVALRLLVFRFGISLFIGPIVKFQAITVLVLPAALATRLNAVGRSRSDYGP